MRLFSTTFCALMLMGFGVLCKDDRPKGPVVDRSCDIEPVKLPANWRTECVGADKRLRSDIPVATRKACEKILANNRILKKRNC